MEQIMSCCGFICSECDFYPEKCKGCSEIKGKAFWLAYTGESVCRMYDCCVNKKGLAHCGMCGELPCERFCQNDPNYSDEENEAERKVRVQRLKGLRSSDMM